MFKNRNIMRDEIRANTILTIYTNGICQQYGEQYF